MKQVLLFAFLAFSLNVFSQVKLSAGLEKKILTNSCNCINKITDSREESYAECVMKAVMIDSIQLCMEFNAASLDTSEMAFIAWGKELGYDLLPRLVETCDKAYFHYDSLLVFGMRPGDMDSIRALVTAGPGTDNVRNKARYLLNEGLVLAADKNWEAALSKFNASLSLDSTDLLSMINKGYALGKLGRGIEGAAVFEQVAEITGNRHVFTIAAVIRRKEGKPETAFKHRP